MAKKMRIIEYRSDGSKDIIDDEVTKILQIYHHEWFDGQKPEPSIRIIYSKNNQVKNYWVDFNPSRRLVGVDIV